MSSQYSSTTYGRVAGRRGAGHEALAQAREVQHLDARRAQVADRGLEGLVEPLGAVRAAGDQQGRPVRVQPEATPGPRAGARCGRAWLIARRSGRPVRTACGSRVPAKVVATYGVKRAPSRLARPGRVLASWTT